MHFDGVIMAAGLGSRLKELSHEQGKALTYIAGKPIINYAIDFMRELGASRIFVIGGYAFPKLQDLLRNSNVTLLENKNFIDKGNLLSLLVALPHISNSLVIANVDHIYSRTLVSRIREQFNGITAFCDFDRELGEDDMKALFSLSPQDLRFKLQEIRLVTMSKTLKAFHGGYVGMTYVDANCLQKYKLAADETFRKIGDKAVVENILVQLSEKGEIVGIGDISGYGWLEIDTPEEFYRAEKAIQESPEKFLVLK